MASNSSLNFEGLATDILLPQLQDFKTVLGVSLD